MKRNGPCAPSVWREQAEIREAPSRSAIAIDASWLPGEMHGDPADRLIVATARHLGLPIVTRDRKILAYAQGGDVAVIGG